MTNTTYNGLKQLPCSHCGNLQFLYRGIIRDHNQLESAPELVIGDKLQGCPGSGKKPAQSELPEIVKRAMTNTVTNIGQLIEQETRTLNTYVKRGYLSKGKGGPFPMIKTVYAHVGFDFAAHRQAHVRHMNHLAELDRQNGYGRGMVISK